MKKPEKTIWCNKMGEVEGKDGFRVNKNTKVCHAHFKNEDVLKVHGGSRWKLKEAAKPIHPCHTAAILSRETKRAFFYHAKPRNGNHGDEA